MSFNIHFTARSVQQARQKLHEVYAPGAVKALIEKALDALPAPQPASIMTAMPRDGVGDMIAKAQPRPPQLIGVHVESCGHIAEAGDHGPSTIERFAVRPLFD
jgi:hypothetical protein